MPSSQTIYAVTITNGNAGVAPSDGFINPLGIQNYPINLESTPASLTLALAKANRRGNLRYREMINQLALVSNCYIITDSIVSDATYHTEATEISFKIIVEHGDASLRTVDELVPGTFLTGMACLVRCMARGLCNTYFRTTDVFDPTNSQSVPASTTSVIRGGSGVSSGFELGPYAADLATAEGFIVVTPVSF